MHSSGFTTVAAFLGISYRYWAIIIIVIIVLLAVLFFARRRSTL